MSEAFARKNGFEFLRHDAQITISRLSSSTEGSDLQITLHLPDQKIVRVEMSLEDFSSAVFGRSYAPCKLIEKRASSNPVDPSKNAGGEE
jgi:hypothetical protein